MSNSDLNISIVDDVQGFYELRDGWNRLEQNFCLSWQWMVAWWMNIGQSNPANQLCLIKLTDGKQLVGIAPLYIERSKVRGRVLKFLGAGDACSDYMTFPALPGYEISMANAVFQLVNHQDFLNRTGGIDSIELEGHIADDLAVQTFIDLASQASFDIDSKELEGCWRVEIPTDWDAFRKVVKKSNRRKINKVDRLNETGDFQTNYLTEPAELEAAWPDFVELHQKRRRLLGQAGCFGNSNFERFLFDATQRLAQEGRVLMTMVSHEGDPLGVILAFVSGNCVGVYQSGLDTEKQNLEPGHFANTMTFRAVQEAGFAELDFLRGDERYKSGWGCERTALHRTQLVAPKLSAQLRHRILVGGRNMKNWTQDLWTRSMANLSRSSEGV